MVYRIIYDKPHRLRIRIGKYILNEKQCYGLSGLLLSISGVTSVATNEINGSVLIEYEDLNARETVLKTINSLLLKEIPQQEPNDEQKAMKVENEFKRKLANHIVKHIIRSMVLPTVGHRLYTCYKAIGYIKMGVSSLGNQKLNVEVLDATAISAAILSKQYKTASSTMFLLKLSDLLLEYSNLRAKNALAKSLTITVDKVWLVQEGMELETSIDAIQIDDVIRIRKGSLIPMDGDIVSGEALINEATITGEPLSVYKTKGKTVFAGTVLEDGEIDIRVITLKNDSRVAKILNLIDTGEKEKANIQSRAERLADNIVPISFGLSILTLLLTQNIMRALSVLMVDFSCAIKLTTPITIISALKESVSHDILIKGGKYLEILSQVDTVVFDKTGTLTNAVPKVSKIISVNEAYNEDEVLRIAACLEEHFPHSVAAAIVATAKKKNLIHPENHGKVEYILAHGIASTFNGQRCIIGSYHFVFEDEKISCPLHVVEQLKHNIGSDSAVYLAVDGKLVGVICITDPPREDAKHMISLLKREGVKEVIMITGDSKGNAEYTCNLLGIHNYYAEVLPDEKASIIEKLKAEGRTVLMVGDGINDTPALSMADVSLTMNGSSDIAREVADISIMSDELTKIITVRQLAQGLMKKIQSQYRFILAFNSTLIALGILGGVSSGTSALLHNASTISISIFSTRPIITQKFSLDYNKDSDETV